MRPDITQLKLIDPELSENIAVEHLNRLGEDYFSEFDDKVVARHIKELSLLSPKAPVRVITGETDDGQVECTILAYDYSSEFSLITGLLAGTGFSILSGNVFTYEQPSVRSEKFWHRISRRQASDYAFLRRRRIVDYFVGRLSVNDDYSAWGSRLEERLNTVMLFLEDGKRNDPVEARRIVNEAVAERLNILQSGAKPVLYPVEIDVNNEGVFTTLRVVSQDTPAFLYTLSNALSLHGISIEGVRIKTTGGQVEDEIDILGSSGTKIIERDLLDKIELSVLLTKQFTYFLGRSPDPSMALSRFQQLVSGIIGLPEKRQWIETFSNPSALRGLAQILGASDFIWEDFVRTQYESILPIVDDSLDVDSPKWSAEEMEQRLKTGLATADNYEKRKAAINTFKDREIFLIDVDHILNTGVDVEMLAEPLTGLAELVVEKSVECIYDRLTKKWGVPRTVGGLPVPFALFGLGKFGGRALGYASDIELLVVYSDNGKTDGTNPVTNAELFDALTEETFRFIEAKSEGIFRIDLRLRPYGASGPKACSLESFCRYYAPSGDTHVFELLALTRLRAVGGDHDLGQQVERLRDEFIYTGREIDVQELRRLRQRQFEEKVKGNRYNAKFSAGALVDLEYYVQELQIAHGKDFTELRTPIIRNALASLASSGVLETKEGRNLTQAYRFLRKLINGLRMLRGNALDLFLPEEDSDEYVHLARRIGYARDDNLLPGQGLYVDFATHTARVRMFIEKYFGRETLPGREAGNVADLILSESVPPESVEKILRKAGFGKTERAYINLRTMAREGAQRDSFVRLAVLACDMLKREPDPDMALNNWERFVNILPDAGRHYEMLLSQPRRLQILLGIFAGSQFLSDALVRNPDFLGWVTDPSNLLASRNKLSIMQDIAKFGADSTDYTDWLNHLRRFRKREILRIGTRDICLHVPMESVISDLSELAAAIVDVCLNKEWQHVIKDKEIDIADDPEKHFCIVAFGKLGGAELNYSSDIDLLGIRDELSEKKDDAVLHDLCCLVMDRIRAALSDHTDEGYVYRVDLRLRPHGTAGELVPSLRSLFKYYESNAELWEIQALLKARPVAGNAEIGMKFLEGIKPVLCQPRDWWEISSSIKRMREKAMQVVGGKDAGDVKTGIGGIRDVEFLVQGLQLLHQKDLPEIFEGNTILAIKTLRKIGALEPALASTLKKDYTFLRRVEHFLQILEDRQTHKLPSDKSELTALARRLLGPASNADTLLSMLNECRQRIERICR